MDIEVTNLPYRRILLHGLLTDDDEELWRRGRDGLTNPARDGPREGERQRRQAPFISTIKPRGINLPRLFMTPRRATNDVQCDSGFGTRRVRSIVEIFDFFQAQMIPLHANFEADSDYWAWNVPQKLWTMFCVNSS